MPEILLIRHAAVDGMGERIHGRIPGIHLNEQGKEDACALAERLGGAGIVAVYSSPRERAQETASPLTQRLGMRLLVDTELDELDYGDWSGRRFSELQDLMEWQQFNRCREDARIPNGEGMEETVSRTERVLERVRQAHPKGCVALVTHGDWIRTAISHLMRMPFAEVLKLEIATASVTVVGAETSEFRVLSWNEGEQPRGIAAILEMRV
jgi:broad specificity phosphatase PhoE